MKTLIKKLSKFLSFTFACIVSMFAPLQGNALEMQGMCCVACAMKKEEEEDRIEHVISDDTDD